MKIKLGIDVNGNSCVKVTNGRNSFTIQTNGNLPVTHRNGKSKFDIGETKEEISEYLQIHGTDRQRVIFNS